MVHFRPPELKDLCISFSQEDWRFQCVAERPRPDLFLDYTKGNAKPLLALGSTRVYADASAGIPVSFNGDFFAYSVTWESTHSVLPAVLQDQGDGFAEIVPALVNRMTLTVCTGNLRAISDEPITIALNDRRELISHSYNLTCFGPPVM